MFLMFLLLYRIQKRSSLVPDFLGIKRCIIEVVDKFYYVPIKKTLSLFVNKHQKAEIVLLRNPRRVDGKLETFLDGEIAQSHPLFSENDETLQIIVYHDEVEICNPIGSKVKKHKVVGVFYYTFGNLAQIYCSKLEAISLLAIPLYTDIQRYSIDAIFQPLLEELQDLATDGCVVQTTSGEEYMLYAALIAYAADTPASKEAAGFKEGVAGTHRPCHFCEATSESMQLYFQEEDFRICNTKGIFIYVKR